MAKRAKAALVKKARKVQRKRPKIRVAFVGAGGRAAGVHYPSLMDIPDVESVAVSALNEERGTKLMTSRLRACAVTSTEARI